MTIKYSQINETHSSVAMATGYSRHKTLTSYMFGIFLIFFLNCFLYEIRADNTDTSGTCPTGCTCSPENATCKNISSFGTFHLKETLKDINIKDHSIAKLSKGSFSGFTALQFLEVTTGKLSEIEAGAFADVSGTLTKLDLSHNQITNLTTGVFTNLRVLTHVYLMGNQLTTVYADTFVSLSQLVELELSYNSIESIEKGAFNDVPALQNLKLKHNKLPRMPLDGLSGLTGLEVLDFEKNSIADIPESSMTSLPKLKTLNLFSNPIYHFKAFPNVSSSLRTLNLGFSHLTEIRDHTWHNLGNLHILELNGVSLKALEQGMFDGLTNLEILSAMHIAVLQIVGPDAFRGLENVKTVDLRYSSRLQDIDESAFLSTKQLKKLFISNCSLTTIHQNLVKWSDMEAVMVKGNAVNCDCKMKWVLDDKNFGDKTDVKTEFQNLVCGYPRVLKGKTIGSLTKNQMVCKSTEDDHSSRVLTGVIVAVCCFVFMTTVAILAANRKRIYLWCRRYYQYRRYKNDMVFTVEHDTSVAELDDTVEARPLKDMKLETVPL